jgi:hypothetical protein
VPSTGEGELPDWPPFAGQRTDEDRVATLKEELAREQLTIRELEARLAEIAGSRAVLNERRRYHQGIRLGVFLGAVALFVVIFLLVAGTH